MTTTDRAKLQDVRPGRWHRPRRCQCAKVPHRTEADARRAPSLPSEMADLPFRVYRCPGSQSWHVATRGFHPRSLKTRARITAYYLLREENAGTRDLVYRVRECGSWPQAEPESREHLRQLKKMGQMLRDMEILGLIERGVPAPGFHRPVDRAGLRRVIEVGLEEYATVADRSVSP